MSIAMRSPISVKTRQFGGNMLKRFFVIVSSVAICVALVSAQESKLTIPVQQTPANDGKQMYVSYCASCHGLDGRGHGPVAGTLKVPPADLSLLSKNNQGVYPDKHVTAVIKFGVENPAHGSKEMPVWGPVLQKIDSPTDVTLAKQSLRIANLVSYVESLQAK
jgi:mono/diheme cytochrome c family protein